MYIFKKLLELSAILICFIAVLTILTHTNTNLDQDLGRHIKTGEIIWHTKNIPKTNLFSFTYPAFPFINHHWGSEVVFYLFFKHSGILSITYLKIAIIFLSVLLILYTSYKISNLPISLISLALFFPLLSSRTDERPEIFGYLFFSLFLAIFLKYKRGGYKGRIIWILPFVQLLWTNMHITFIYGFLLLFLFLVDFFLNHKSPKFPKLLKILILSFFLSLLNPNGLSGLLYPLNVFKNYGYTIVENQNLFFLSALTSNIFIKIFWFQAAIITTVGLISFLLSLKYKKIKTDIFYLLLLSCFLFLSIIMLRNFPFFVFVAIISFSFFLKSIIMSRQNLRREWMFEQGSDQAIPSLTGRARNDWSRLSRDASSPPSKFSLANGLLIIIILINSLFIYLITSNTFYQTFDLNKKFELRVESSYEKAVDFFIEKKLPGPIFNNFDIGGYLDFRGLKVFVDNRPEAYPADFFEEYKNAQLNPNLMNALINRYKINSIIFSHTDATDWGTNLVRIADKLDGFKLVYADANVIILTKNLSSNLLPRRLATVTQGRSPWERKEFFGAQNYRDLLSLARLYNLSNKNETAAEMVKKAYEKNPSSCITRLNYGSILAQQENLYLKNQGLEILKSTWYCPFPKK